MGKAGHVSGQVNQYRPYTLYTRYIRIFPYNLIHLDLTSLSQPLFVQIYFFWCQMIALGELSQYDVSVCLKAVI
jgi:hypothetical protein